MSVVRTIAEDANDFADLRTLDGGNCIYVDKTDYFHRLVTDPGRRLFFIARPRRFGKSLTDPTEAERVRSELANIYGQFKERTHMIRFLMITGVSKFTKMSVFSTARASGGIG